MNKALNMLLGLIAGAMVGSALGILLAPSSGRQLATEIQNFGDQMRNDISHAADARREELEEQLARLRGEILYD